MFSSIIFFASFSGTYTSLDWIFILFFPFTNISLCTSNSTANQNLHLSHLRLSFRSVANYLARIKEQESFTLAANWLDLRVLIFCKPLEACMLNTGDFYILNGNGDGIHLTKLAQIKSCENTQ